MRLSGVIAALLLGSVLSAAGAQAQQVTLTQGTIAGRTDEGVTAFLGIPYAAPPVGPDRWRAPQPRAPLGRGPRCHPPRR